MNQIFNKQENALKRHETESRKTSYISRRVAKKIQRPVNQLLMTKTENFRTVKELRDKFDEEVKNTNPRPPHDWTLRLRDECSDHYINLGTVYPTWALYHYSTKNNEIIRNPVQKLNFSDKEFKFMKNEGYLKNKISKRNSIVIKFLSLILRSI